MPSSSLLGASYMLREGKSLRASVVDVGVVKKYISIAAKKLIEYRAQTLYLGVFVLLSVFVYPTLWYGLAKKFGSLNGWTFPTLFLLGSLTNLMFAIIDFIGLFNIYSLFKDNGRTVLTVYMTRPYSVMKQVLLSNIDATALGRIVPELILVSIIIIYFKINIGLNFFLAFFMGVSAFSAFLIMLIAGLFALDKSGEGLIRVAWTGVRFAAMPLNQLSGFAQAMLYIITPIAFIGSVPASTVFNSLSIGMVELWLLSIAFSSILTLIFLRSFKKNFEAIGG
ncbi:MAG: hypothetical protein D6769_02060 [Methanobacteriota archaeon]|nr:MAG: hypothetical protein D6769_02060 [Euryarchaeota archaeon]